MTVTSSWNLEFSNVLDSSVTILMLLDDHLLYPNFVFLNSYVPFSAHFYRICLSFPKEILTILFGRTL